MSSPFWMPNHGVPERATATPPALAPKPAPAPAPQTSDDPSIRSMRLKVLYTFDDQNKTNCLARWPQLLEIRTAFLDESTQIGVIELKTCLQAIVSASPELVAKLGHDYTVYAYDYSEYETPLVGQGMLSWALASSSSTPTAPAHQSKTMITGRVCKNILGLFGGASQDTLEVKLRLVPVPTCLQSEYLESMKKYREISRLIPEGLDIGAWTSFLQANPGILQTTGQNRSQTPAQGDTPKERAGIEHVQRLLDQGAASSDLGTPGFESRIERSFSTGAAEKVPKRRGRPPKTGPKAAAPTQRRASTNQGLAECGYASSDDRFEDGPTKKRAKVTKADAPNKTSFGQQPDSLRVAASTAASVRIHQPTAIRPQNSVPGALEAPPRAPTPIEDPAAHMKRPGFVTARSSLRRESFILPDESTYESPYPPSDVGTRPPESAMTSPEASRHGSSGETPVDISSSPPIFRGASTAPSSPRLPVMSREIDSGFMSGSVNDLFDDEEFRPIDEEDREMAARYSKRAGLSEPLPKPPEPVLPKPRDTRPAPQPQDLASEKAIALSRKSARNAVGLGRTTSSGSIPRPSAAASDPVRPSNLQRSQTWTGHEQGHGSLEVSTGTVEKQGSAHSEVRSRSDSGSGATRRKKIQSKLASSIAAGEMPPFCDHCGAIETPTWRKAWVKIHSGTPEHVRISDEGGGILTWQTLQTDESGVVCLYRIFKKSLLSTDEGFSEVLLCNPCGLWLHNRKCMRPKETWEKPKPNPDGKRKRKSSGNKKSTQPLPAHPASDKSQDAGAQPPGGSSPPVESSEENLTQMSPQLPAYKRPRARSVQLSPSHKMSGSMNKAAATAALQRAIQSSPARLGATQEAPILVADLTPKPTSRILFPSPTQCEEARSKNSNLSHTSSRSGAARNSENSLEYRHWEDDQNDKENCPPPEAKTGILDDLFQDDSQPCSRPTTPTPSSNSKSTSFKTPKGLSTPNRLPPTTGDFFSSTARALLQHPNTPKRAAASSDTVPLGELTPFTAHLNQLFSETRGSPSANLDFPSLPSLHNTPEKGTCYYDFGNFDSQDFFSTDAPMPSSPPIWFGVYEDPIDQDSSGPLSDYQIPNLQSSPPKETEVVSQTTTGAQSPSLVIDERGCASVDFTALG